MNSYYLLALAFPIALLQGLFAGSEIAVLSMDPLKLRGRAKKGSKRAQVALRLQDHPHEIFAISLFITSICVIIISTIVSFFVVEHIGENLEWLAILISSPLIVFVGEILPKSFFRKRADKYGDNLAIILWATFYALYPITRSLGIYTQWISKLVSPIENLFPNRKSTIRDDLRAIAHNTHKTSEADAAEVKMVKRIFDFKDSEAQHALIPLVKVEAIEENISVEEAVSYFKKHRHSRMPVYQNRIDNIVGILNVKNLLNIQDQKKPINNFVEKANYVPETQSLDEVLFEMEDQDCEMAIVVDEHGGAVGILTFEDIIEEVVGEIQDEYDQEKPPYRPLKEGKWLVESRMEIKAINENLHLELPEGQYETLSGFLLQQFGRIPENGDELYIDTGAGSLKFVIQKATERKIEIVVIERLSTHT